MIIIKSVAYCFETSHNAELLGKHGFYIQQQIRLEDGNLSEPYIEQGYQVFDDLNDPDLRQLLSEVEGEVSKYSLLSANGTMQNY